MGLFGKKVAKTVSCPICEEGLPLRVGHFAHWETHVTVIPEGQGDASGQFTWRCRCGPANMKWPRVEGAAAGLALHMNQRHSIPL